MPTDVDLQHAHGLFGVFDGVVDDVADHGRADAEDGREQEAEQEHQTLLREDGFGAGAGQVGDADAAVLEAGVDACFFDFADEFFVELFVGFGFALELLVFEGAAFELVPLGLGFADGAS